jgi:hypothetical protein
MKRLSLAIVFGLYGSLALAQGVKESSTPRSVIIVTPPEQPSRPTAVPNIPPQATPPLSVRRAYPYRVHGNQPATPR